MLLQPLQDLLANIYDLSMHYRVDDFLVTERAHLPPAVRDTDTDEQVVVVESADGDDSAAVGLFLDPGLLARLSAANPIEALHSGNVADYWTALEGVSHFICLAWNADHNRAVSLLELELQAEIDKYVTSWWLLREQDPVRVPAELHRLLFERCRVDEVLAGGRAELYRQANRYAARFCQRMQQLLIAETTRRQQALCELRRFYRLSHERKMRHIGRD